MTVTIIQHTTGTPVKLEEWTVQDGMAKPTFLAKKHPIYDAIHTENGIVTPKDGVKFLAALIDRCNHSTYLEATHD